MERISYQICQQFEPDLGQNGSVTAKLASSKVSDCGYFCSTGVVHPQRFRKCSHAFWKLRLCVFPLLSRKLSWLCLERPGGAAKDCTIQTYSWKTHDGMDIKWQHPIAPPCQTIVLAKEHLGAAKPSMTQTSENIAKDARFGCTLGFVHAYWHIYWDSGGPNFLASLYFGCMNISAHSPGPQLHVDMLIVAIRQDSRKIQRLLVFTHFP